MICNATYTYLYNIAVVTNYKLALHGVINHSTIMFFTSTATITLHH